MSYESAFYSVHKICMLINITLLSPVSILLHALCYNSVFLFVQSYTAYCNNNEGLLNLHERFHNLLPFSHLVPLSYLFVIVTVLSHFRHVSFF